MLQDMEDQHHNHHNLMTPHGVGGLLRPPHPFMLGGLPTPGLMDPNHPLARFLGAMHPSNGGPPMFQHQFPPSFDSTAVSTTSTSTANSSGPSSPVDLTTSDDLKTSVDVTTSDDETHKAPGNRVSSLSLDRFVNSIPHDDDSCNCE